jgi:hypothetical protein
MSCRVLKITEAPRPQAWEDTKRDHLTRVKDFQFGHEAGLHSEKRRVKKSRPTPGVEK